MGYDFVSDFLFGCFGIEGKSQRLVEYSYYECLVPAQMIEEIKICDFMISKGRGLPGVIREIWEKKREALWKKRMSLTKPQCRISSFASYIFIVGLPL